MVFSLRIRKVDSLVARFLSLRHRSIPSIPRNPFVRRLVSIGDTPRSASFRLGNILFENIFEARFPAPDLSDKRSHFIMPLEKAVFSPHQMRNQRALNGRERGQRRLLLLVFLEIIPPDEREQHPNGDRYAQLFRWLVLG